MKSKERIFSLKNPIKNYAWGSKTLISALAGIPNPARQPQAEMWMGAHPSSPSIIEIKNQEISLLELINKAPKEYLGDRTAQKFNQRLPFLFKVLAAAEPLSIQAHPSLEQAREGYKRENDLGVSLEAYDRSYKDDNHKPELICALTPFWVLCGFRKIERILDLFESMRSNELRIELRELKRNPTKTGLKDFYSNAMSMSKPRTLSLVKEITSYAIRNAGTDTVSRWVLKLSEHYPGDIGVLSPIILNLVQLQPGEALYLPAGELHAYLEGLGIEIMANSDNVLRGGCTPKHVNVLELLKVLTFGADDIHIIKPKRMSPVEMAYLSDAEEFRLSAIKVSRNVSFKRSTRDCLEIIICTEGFAEIYDLEFKKSLVLQKGSSAVVPACVPAYEIRGEGACYKAAVP